MNYYRKKSLKSDFGELTNLNKHIQRHENTCNWYVAYIETTYKRVAKTSEETFDLVKYVISSH